MMRFLLIAFCLMVATDSYALSCMQPNPARTFNWLQDEQTLYHVAHGHLKPVDVERIDGAKAETQFVGQILGKSAEVSVPVTIQIRCSGPWCGSAPHFEGERLLFLEVTDNGYVFHATACGGNIFDVPQKQAFKMLRSCLKKEMCTDADIARFER